MTKHCRTIEHGSVDPLALRPAGDHDIVCLKAWPDEWPFLFFFQHLKMRASFYFHVLLQHFNSIHIHIHFIEIYTTWKIALLSPSTGLLRRRAPSGDVYLQYCHIQVEAACGLYYELFSKEVAMLEAT